MQNINFISLNIEHDRHLNAVLQFLKTHQPDVILLQELFEDDLLLFEQELKMHSVFAGLNFLKNHSERGSLKLGLATLTRLPLLNHQIIYYHGSGDVIPYTTMDEPEKMARAIIVAEVEKNGQRYYFINVYFTWSPNATPNQQQFENFDKLSKILADIPDFILSGDLNSPRGKVIFDSLANKYQDHIPQHVTTTIDKNLHRYGDLNIVVDCLFTTQHYQVPQIAILDGISDHCAIVATIKRNS